MASREITCRELVEVVTAWLDDALPPTERARFEEHIASCVACVTYLEQMRQTIRLLGRLTEETIAPEAREELMRRFADW